MRRICLVNPSSGAEKSDLEVEMVPRFFVRLRNLKENLKVRS